MFNDDGLGQAMSDSYNREKAEEANSKADRLRLSIDELVKVLDLFSESIQDLDRRLRVLEGRLGERV